MDINAIKNRLNQLQTTTSTKNSFWKPEPGKTQIRIVPYKFNKDNPFQELFFHYQFENKTMVSPVTYGRPDPINEFSTKLKSTGVKDDWIQGKRLEPKMRTYAPVVVRGQESEGVKFWGFGKTVYQELLSIIADPDYGDITDAINGRDITVEKMTPAEAGNQYGKTTIRVKPNMTPLTEDKEQLKSMIESQVDINTLYNEPTYDELKEVLDRYMNPDSQEEETEEESTSEPVATTVSDAGDAFDELFSSK
tara:strand:- start:2310 stop:3059 length:750 start_codon:yes stop_codon:yes gene_type:complete